MADTILCVYFYSNGDHKYNVVDVNDLDNHIEYNRTFRPGRIMFMEDKDCLPKSEGDIGLKLINDGMLKPEYLEPFYDQAKELMAKLKKTVNMNQPTIPYC